MANTGPLSPAPPSYLKTCSAGSLLTEDLSLLLFTKLYCLLSIKRKGLFFVNRSVRLTDLLNEVPQSSVLQTGVSSLYSCGGLQHCPFLILSMPSGKEMTAAFSLHTPLMYFPNEQFAHPGPLRADSQLISLHLSFPVINRRQS